MTVLPVSANSSMDQADQLNEQLRWYALRTKSRHEKLVRDRLESQGVEPLLPTVRRLSHWRDRTKEIEVPLFSGYCFVRFSWPNRLPVLKVSGVVDIVGSSCRPESIPDEEIAALKALMDSVLPYDAHPYLREGMTVEVVRGPLEGVRGILLRKGKHHRLVIGVRLIQQAAAVEIDVNDVVPADPNHRASCGLSDDPVEMTVKGRADHGQTRHRPY